MSYSITLIVFVHVDHQLSLVISILGRLALDNNGICRRLSIADEVRRIQCWLLMLRAKLKWIILNWRLYKYTSERQLVLKKFKMSLHK